MTLLPGKVTVTCPKTGNEVNVRTTCVECSDYKHITWEGVKPLICCTYEKKPDPEPEKKEREGIGGLKRW